MIPSVRAAYNASFSQEKYDAFLADLNAAFNKPILFRVAETPIFIPKELKHQMFQACNDVIDVICRPDFKELTKNAVPKDLVVPNEDKHTLFLAIDMGICYDENNKLTPQIVEIQGFPSLYGYENFIGQKYRQYFSVPEQFTTHFSNFDYETYPKFLKKVLLGDCEAENVILLEVEPEKQGTNIDFYVTEHYTGIKPVCITKVMREGRKLFYMNNGEKTPIYRIYNRVIFDEFKQRTDLNCQFNLTEDVDIQWVGHPNWFFKISKFTLPFIKSKYVPETWFLDQIPEIPKDLENYVLKPLFSFAGAGVVFNVTPQDIENVVDKSNYILQRKMRYAPELISPDGNVKAEVRMLFLWQENEERPTLVINLSRLSKGDLIGVKFNKNKTWVGGSIGYFEND